MGVMRYAIKERVTETYYRRMTLMGPQFGADEQTRMTFATRNEAADVASTFPLAACAMSDVVEVAK